MKVIYKNLNAVSLETVIRPQVTFSNRNTCHKQVNNPIFYQQTTWKAISLQFVSRQFITMRIVVSLLAFPRYLLSDYTI